MQGLSERPFSRQKRTFSGDIDEYEPDVKAYRYLMSLFADNLNYLSKNYKDVMGELQQIPKIKISRDEQFGVNEHLERVYRKMEDKVTRDAIHKNNYLRKGYQQFTSHYFMCHPDIEQKMAGNGRQVSQSPEKGNWVSNIGNSNPMNTISNLGTISPSPSKKNSNAITYSPSKRPMSSKQRQANVMASIDQAFNGFNNQVAQALKMKTITGNFYENPEKNERKEIMASQRATLREEIARTKRTFFNRQKRQEGRYDLQQPSPNCIFNGSEIVIYDRRPKTIEQNKQSIQGNNSFTRGKYSHKRILNIKSCQRKSINQIERMQIENKLMMINSAMTINPTQSQGYKAKSKCWQNYFN